MLNLARGLARLALALLAVATLAPVALAQEEPAVPPGGPDFNADGKGDLLWHNQSTGELYAWLMNGATVTGGSYLNPSRLADLNWQVRGLADFNGDGHGDVLWHNQSTGDLYVWLMTGTSVTSGAYLSPARGTDLGWQVKGVADFNGDGKPDLLWQSQSSGEFSVWLMNGVTRTTAVATSPAGITDPQWQIRGLADFNGDGHVDILWHHQTSGDLYVWLMSGTSVTTGTYLSPSRFADTRWQIRSLNDANGDGKPDLLWHHQSTGDLYVWVMNGTSVTTGTYLSPSRFADTRWQIAPRPPAGAGGGGVPTGSGSARDVAAKLGRPARFLVGMGNDLANDHNQDGAYTLGVTLDLHYAYLVGLQGQGGWPDWNAGGTFVNILADTAAAHGVVPMFSLYQMAAWGEGNLAALTNDGFMAPYWSGARLLFQRLAVFNKPAVVHYEADFWGFAQSQNGNPAAIPVRVKAHAPECADLPDNLTGMGKCLVRLARTISPKVVIGFHASEWSGSPAATSAYLNAIGANQADIVVVETLDRDAGCFEAAVDPNCQRGAGPFYWDATNATSPNFHEHLAWARAISTGVGRPLLWWQMPFGVPSGQRGGTPGHYRDNRVQYLFAHPDEFVAAGGVGAVFGVGAGNQTYIDTDGGQFRTAVTRYLGSPAALP